MVHKGFLKLHFVAPHGGVTRDTVIWTGDSDLRAAMGDYKSQNRKSEVSRPRGVEDLTSTNDQPDNRLLPAAFPTPATKSAADVLNQRARRPMKRNPGMTYPKACDEELIKDQTLYDEYVKELR